MVSALKQIYKWQVDAGNAARPYDDKLEDAFTIEESLEDHGNLHKLAELLGVDPDVPKLPMALSRKIMEIVYTEPLTDVQRLDKIVDKTVFAIGSNSKLGLNAQQINEALLIVNRANVQKLKNKTRDAEGKLMKPADFVGPEVKLQELLNKRK